MEEYRFLFCVGLIVVLAGMIIYLLKELMELKDKVWEVMLDSKVSIRNEGENYYPIWHTVAVNKVLKEILTHLNLKTRYRAEGSLEFYPQEKSKKK